MLGILSLRGVRWAYVAFVAAGLLYFPAKAGFQLNPHPCQLTFDISLAIHSLTNYGHIVLFAIFFVMSSAQFQMSGGSPVAWAALAAIVMGGLVELAQGVTGEGNCRSRDLIADAIGILVGAAIVWLLIRRGWRPRPTWSLAWWRGTA
jgi:hypothetical protein